MNIRKYQDSDKQYLRNISKETAWDSYKKNKRKLESVPIMFNDYFTENEPDNIFVLADDHDIPVGYIICSTNYKQFVHLNKTMYIKRLLKVAPSQMLFQLFFLNNLKKIKDRANHFHIDILPAYQGQGWGPKLIATLCAHLKANGENHLSGCSVNKKSIGYKTYIKYGFHDIYNYGHNVVSISIDL